MRVSRLPVVAAVHLVLFALGGGCIELNREPLDDDPSTSGGRRATDSHTPPHDGSGAGGEASAGAAGAEQHELEAGGASDGGAPNAGAGGDSTLTADAGGDSNSAAGAGGDSNAAGAGGGSNAAGAGGGSSAAPIIPVGLAAEVCPEGPFGNPLPATRVATRLDAVPPPDDFNDFGRARRNIEGPLWWNGALYVSEFALIPVPESRILKITPDGDVSIQLTETGSNGLAFAPDGAVLRANHRDGSVDRIDLETGEATPIVTTYDGARFNSPNDIAVRADGTIYFTDPSWQAPLIAPQRATRVYRISPDGDLSVVDDTRPQPNGITLSLDETTLYVAGLDGVRRHPVFEDGSVGLGVPLKNAPLSVDGMSIDCAGNLYLTSGRTVLVLDAAGNSVGTITTADPIEALTNVAFGGPDRKTLFITGLGTTRGVFRIELNVPGLPY